MREGIATFAESKERREVLAHAIGERERGRSYFKREGVGTKNEGSLEFVDGDRSEKVTDRH